MSPSYFSSKYVLLFGRRTHTQAHTHTHTHIHTHTYTHKHAKHMHNPYIHTNTHTHIHTLLQTRRDKHAHTWTRAGEKKCRADVKWKKLQVLYVSVLILLRPCCCCSIFHVNIMYATHTWCWSCGKVSVYIYNYMLQLLLVKCLHSAYACVYMCARVCVWCVC